MKQLLRLSSGAVLTFALFSPPAVHAIGLTFDTASFVKSEVTVDSTVVSDENNASDPLFPQSTSVEALGSVSSVDWSFENSSTGAIFSAENVTVSVPGGDSSSEIIANADFDLAEASNYSITGNISASGQFLQTLKVEVTLVGPSGILVEVNQEIPYLLGPIVLPAIPGGAIEGDMPAGAYSLELKFGVFGKNVQANNTATGGFTVTLGDPSSDPTDPLIGGSPIDGFTDWYSSDWFGDYNTTGAPWLFHAQHGFIFIDSEGTTASMFIYDDAMSTWWWTSDLNYPFLYAFDPPADNAGTDIGAEWIFFFEGTAGPRSFGIVTGPSSGGFLFFGP